MFEYVKTLNSDTHSTPVEEYPTSSADENTNEIKPGMIVSLTFGEISPVYSSVTPMYLVVGTYEKKGTVMVKCVKLLPGMVIKGMASSFLDSSMVGIGSMLGVEQDSYGKGASFSNEGDWRFEIIDMEDGDGALKLTAYVVK